MKFIGTLTELLSFPIMVLNLLGGLTGGIWLLFLGQWKIVVGSLIVAMFGSYVLMAPLLLGLIFAIPVNTALKRGQMKWVSFLAGISMLYKTSIMVIWACGVLILFCEKAQQYPILPFLLTSYGVATTPWASMASAESDSSGFNPGALMTFWLSAGYIGAIAVRLCGGSYLYCFASIATFTLLGAVINFFATLELDRAQRPF